MIGVNEGRKNVHSVVLRECMFASEDGGEYWREKFVPVCGEMYVLDNKSGSSSQLYSVHKDHTRNVFL